MLRHDLDHLDRLHDDDLHHRERTAGGFVDDLALDDLSVKLGKLRVCVTGHDASPSAVARASEVLSDLPGLVLADAEVSHD